MTWFHRRFCLVSIHTNFFLWTTKDKILPLAIHGAGVLLEFSSCFDCLGAAVFAPALLSSSLVISLVLVSRLQHIVEMVKRRGATGAV